jgi:tRNA1Val (adenine37-N6)-methyltransferase
MAYYFPDACIHAIDTDEEALKLVRHNVLHSPWAKRMKVSHENLSSQPDIENERFDLIVSNPPYYTTYNLPKKEYKARAKHSVVPEREWMTGLIHRLHHRGHLCLVLPSSMVFPWIAAANDLGWYIADRMEVFSFSQDKTATRSLLHFSTALKKPEWSRITIYAAPQIFTNEYITLTGIIPGHKSPVPSLEVTLNKEFSAETE